LPWINSTLLKGNVVDAMAGLEHRRGNDIGVLGSREVIQALRQSNLVDEYVLLIHPLVLGTGRRLLPDGCAFASLRLVDAKPTSTGVLIATYQPTEGGRE
jgi:dihydrofolate reductase